MIKNNSNYRYSQDTKLLRDERVKSKLNNVEIYRYELDVNKYKNDIH